MSNLTHEQFDEKVTGLAATYEALNQIDFKPSSLTDGAVEDSVLYWGSAVDPLGHDFTIAVCDALQRLRFDVGCWGRLTHDSEIYLDEADTDSKLEMAGILAMMTAPKGQEKFNEAALTIYELLENVVQGNRVIVARPAGRRFVDGEWKNDVQESGKHNGKIQVTFDNGHISSRVISIWSDRPENIHSYTPDDRGFYHQVVFPLLTVDLEALASGKLQILYPPTNEAAA